MGDSEALISLESKLVHFCAPTLAGIKPASMFSCRVGFTESEEGQLLFEEAQLERLIVRLQERLEPLGICVVPLSRMRAGLLVYVYRSAQLLASISEADQAAFLENYGYIPSNLPACISLLRNRLHACYERCGHVECAEAFPHEIGVFLGYPLHDVLGFIANKGKGFLCCGLWKAYEDSEGAQRQFEAIRECTAELDGLRKNGMTVEQIISTRQASYQGYFVRQHVGAVG